MESTADAPSPVAVADADATRVDALLRRIASGAEELISEACADETDARTLADRIHTQCRNGGLPARVYMSQVFRPHPDVAPGVVREGGRFFFSWCDLDVRVTAKEGRVDGLKTFEAYWGTYRPTPPAPAATNRWNWAAWEVPK
jgi:hypothetical protein